MTDDTPEPIPLYERFRVTYPGTVIECFYGDGEPLHAVEVAHPMAQVTAIEESRVGVEVSP